jgi:hypothetical protein
MQMLNILDPIKSGLQPIDTFTKKKRRKPSSDPDQEGNKPKCNFTRTFVAQHTPSIFAKVNARDSLLRQKGTALLGHICVPKHAGSAL